MLFTWILEDAIEGNRNKGTTPQQDCTQYKKSKIQVTKYKIQKTQVTSLSQT